MHARTLFRCSHEEAYRASCQMACTIPMAIYRLAVKAGMDPAIDATHWYEPASETHVLEFDPKDAEEFLK